MQYRLLAVDMDGTLLTNQKKITPSTEAAIRAGIARGMIFVMSTGRPLMGLTGYAVQLGLTDSPFITYNGAMCLAGTDHKVIHAQNVSPDAVRCVLAEAEKRKTTVVVWSCDTLYASEINDRINSYKKLSGTEPHLLTDPERLIKQGIQKLLWYDEIPLITRYQSEMRTLLGDQLNIHTSNPAFLEFVDIHASKGLALQKLGEHLGILPAEMIAVGDGENDLPMLRYAGLSVAMANASQPVKNACQVETASNEKDGVAKIIRKYFC